MSSITLKELSDLAENSDPEYCYVAIRDLISEHLPPHYRKFLDAMPKAGPITARKLADKLDVEINYAGTVLLGLEELNLVHRNWPRPGHAIVWRRS